MTNQPEGPELSIMDLISNPIPFEYAEMLSAPFDEQEIKQRTGRGGMKFDYIDARIVADRLNETVGVGNWGTAFKLIYAGPPSKRTILRPQWEGGQKIGERKDEIDFQVVAVECSLTVLGVTKADVGQALEEEEGFKSAYSDAFKRAAVHFGIGRYLYNKDRKPQPTQQRSPPANGSAPQSRQNGPQGAPAPSAAQQAVPARQGAGPANPSGKITGPQVMAIRKFCGEEDGQVDGPTMTALAKFVFDGKGVLELNEVEATEFIRQISAPGGISTILDTMKTAEIPAP
jgi:hypothetical protein